jgi:hypothetical protein
LTYFPNGSCNITWKWKAWRLFNWKGFRRKRLRPILRLYQIFLLGIEDFNRLTNISTILNSSLIVENKSVFYDIQIGMTNLLHSISLYNFYWRGVISFVWFRNYAVISAISFRRCVPVPCILLCSRRVILLSPNA